MRVRLLLEFSLVVFVVAVDERHACGWDQVGWWGASGKGGSLGTCRSSRGSVAGPGEMEFYRAWFGSNRGGNTRSTYTYI